MRATPNRWELEGSILEIGGVMEFPSGRFKREVLVRTTDGDFTNTVKVDFWGPLAHEVEGYRVDDNVLVGINIRSNEYMGKWYTNVNGWRINLLQHTAAATPRGTTTTTSGAASPAAPSSASVSAGPQQNIASKIPEFDAAASRGGTADDDVDAYDKNGARIADKIPEFDAGASRGGAAGDDDDGETNYGGQNDDDDDDDFASSSSSSSSRTSAPGAEFDASSSSSAYYQARAPAAAPGTRDSSELPF